MWVLLLLIWMLALVNLVYEHGWVNGSVRLRLGCFFRVFSYASCCATCCFFSFVMCNAWNRLISSSLELTLFALHSNTVSILGVVAGHGINHLPSYQPLVRMHTVTPKHLCWTWRPGVGLGWKQKCPWRRSQQCTMLPFLGSEGLLGIKGLLSELWQKRWVGCRWTFLVMY